MSGHNKWASIKHHKAAQDNKRGRLFTKIIKEITTAARLGGGSPETNPRLRVAVQSARDGNMPVENVERAIKKGTGELPGVTYEEVSYEGYGPAGVAVYVQCLTDNKNRSAAEVRSIFSKKNGNMAGAGSVAWIFEKKGLLIVKADAVEEDTLMELALSAGAEDFSKQGEVYEITCLVPDFEAVKQALAAKKIPTETAQITMLPKNLTKVDVESAKQILALVDDLEEHDDVQNVYTNADFPDEAMEM